MNFLTVLLAVFDFFIFIAQSTTTLGLVFFFFFNIRWLRLDKLSLASNCSLLKQDFVKTECCLSLSTSAVFFILIERKSLLSACTFMWGFQVAQC